MKTIYLLTFILGLSLSGQSNTLTAAAQSTLTNPCTPGATITAIPNTYGCYSFTAFNGIPNDPDSYYLWDFGDGSNGTGKTMYHCYAPSNNVSYYTITLTYQSPALCGAVPDTQAFLLILNPPANGLCVHPTASVTVSGYSVTVFSGSGIPEIFYNYQYGDGQPPIYDNDYVYDTCGNYIITIKSWDMNQPNDTCYGYNAVNINCSAVTGINEKSGINKTEQIFPNPCLNTLQFIVPEPLNSICISTIAGSELYHKQYSTSTADTLELGWLAPGIYMITFTYEDGKQKTRKFVKY